MIIVGDDLPQQAAELKEEEKTSSLEPHGIASFSQSPMRGMEVGERRGWGYCDGTVGKAFASPLMPASHHSLELCMGSNLGRDTWQTMRLDPLQVLPACV